MKINHHGLDHLAICVPSTDDALKIWRDQFGFTPLAALRADEAFGYEIIHKEQES